MKFMIPWRQRSVNKLLSMLGLARRAGKLVCGYDASVEAAAAGEAKGLIAAIDISDKTFKNLKFEADKHGLPCLRMVETTFEASAATGRKAGVFAVCDEGFFGAIKDIIENQNTAERVRETTAEGEANE